MFSRKIAAALGAGGVRRAARSRSPRKPARRPQPELPPAAIQIDNFQYRPPTLVVAPGTTVTWTNADDERAHGASRKTGSSNPPRSTPTRLSRKPSPRRANTTISARSTPI